jgi:hypothetical protein
MTRKLSIAALLSITLTVLWIGTAKADSATFYFDRPDTALAGTGTSVPYGASTVTLNGDGSISVNVSMNAGVTLNKLGFNVAPLLPSDILVDQTSLNSNPTVIGYSLGGAPITFGSTGDYAFAIYFDGTGSGVNFNIVGTSTFSSIHDVFSSASPFTAQVTAGDVTGYVLDHAAVPEPGSLALFGSGLLSVAGILRRKMAIVRAYSPMRSPFPH